MKNVVVGNWWLLALRGLWAVVIGLLALFWPGVTMASVIIVFAAYALVDGVFAMTSAFRNRQRFWALAFEGVACLAAAAIAIIWPGITALALLYVIAAWAVVTGVFEIAAAIRLRKTISGELLLGLSGLISIAFGILLFARPTAGALTLVWLCGSYALAFGIVMITLGFFMRAYRHPHDAPRPLIYDGSQSAHDAGAALHSGSHP